jgi:hypothetical protein
MPAAVLRRKGVSMKKKFVFSAMLVFLLALGLVFVSCDNGTSPGGDPPNNGTGDGDGDGGDGDGNGDGKTPGGETGDGIGGGSIVGEWKVSLPYTQDGMTVSYVLYISFTEDNKWGFRADLFDSITTDWGLGDYEYKDFEYNPATRVLTLTNTITDESDGTSEEGPVEGKARASGDILIISDLPKIYEFELGPEMLNQTYIRADKTAPIDTSRGEGNLVGSWDGYTAFGATTLTFSDNTWEWRASVPVFGDFVFDGDYTYDPSTGALEITEVGEPGIMTAQVTFFGDRMAITRLALFIGGKEQPLEDPGPGLLCTIYTPKK